MNKCNTKYFWHHFKVIYPSPFKPILFKLHRGRINSQGDWRPIGRKKYFPEILPTETVFSKEPKNTSFPQHIRIGRCSASAGPINYGPQNRELPLTKNINTLKRMLRDGEKRVLWWSRLYNKQHIIKNIYNRLGFEACLMTSDVTKTFNCSNFHLFETVKSFMKMLPHFYCITVTYQYNRRRREIG